MPSGARQKGYKHHSENRRGCRPEEKSKTNSLLESRMYCTADAEAVHFCVLSWLSVSGYGDKDDDDDDDNEW